MNRIWILAAALATLAAPAAFAGPARLDAGVYSPRTDAPMLVQAAHRWTCVARSRTSMGYEVSTSLAVAKRGALAQCAVRTRRGLVCVITSCR
jgi:hypothetical protein